MSLPVTRQEARECGSKRYHTGKPCLRGHVADRYTLTGNCSECNNEKERARYAREIDKERARGKVYRETDRGRATCREKSRRWRANNPDYSRELDRKSASRRYWADPENAREKKRAYNKTEAGKASAQRARHKRRSLIKEQNRDAITHIKLAERDNWKCAICGRMVSKKTWSIDHIVPVSKGGPHTWDNVQLAHRMCNIKKRDSCGGQPFIPGLARPMHEC